MDQFTAHLDRGWDLAQRGDADGAESSAKRALELEADSPEAHNLLGFSRALRGEHEEALELYQQAIALDDTFLEAVLNAAELCIHPLGDPEAALVFCEVALELVESDEELTDALLLQFDAMLGLGREDDAKLICDKIPKGPYQNPIHSFLVGRAHFEVGDRAVAETLLNDAARKDPENPEAPYYLAMIHDERGEAKAATAAFLKSLALDARLAPLPWSLSPDSFEAAARQGISKLNPRLSAFIDPEEIYITRAPGIEVIVEGADPRSPVLLDALEGTRPALRVFVYQSNVERAAGGIERIGEVIVMTLEREIATAIFGESEAPDPDNGTLN